MNNKFLWGIFVFLGLFIIVLFVKWEVLKLQELNAAKENLQVQIESVKSEHEKLKKISNSLDKNNKDFDQETLSLVEKFSNSLKEDELLEFMFSKISRLNWVSSSLIKRPQVEIKNISITQARENLMKFLESDINFSVKVPNETKLKEVLTFLNNNEKYKFFITSLTYEKNKDSSSNSEEIEISIPLKVFYK